MVRQLDRLPRTPDPPPTSRSLRATAPIAAENVWAVGQTRIGARTRAVAEHYDGKICGWIDLPSPGVSLTRLLLMSGTSGSDVWAVGECDQDGVFLTLAEH